MEKKEKIKGAIHQGNNLKRLREGMGLKQEFLAVSLGVSQATVSMWENSPLLKEDVINKVAEKLNVNPEVIKNMEQDPVMLHIENNTYNLEEGSFVNNSKGDPTYNSGKTFNSSDEVTKELREQLEKQKAENEALRKQLADLISRS